MIGGALLATGVGALDGLAASGDTDAKRSWHPVGLGPQGGVVLGLGWSPLVELASAGAGAIAVLSGSRTAGPALMFPGLALLARAGTFYAMERDANPPIPTQG